MRLVDELKRLTENAIAEKKEAEERKRAIEEEQRRQQTELEMRVGKEKFEEVIQMCRKAACIGEYECTVINKIPENQLTNRGRGVTGWLNHLLVEIKSASLPYRIEDRCDGEGRNSWKTLVIYWYTN